MDYTGLLTLYLLIMDPKRTVAMADGLFENCLYGTKGTMERSLIRMAGKWACIDHGSEHYTSDTHQRRPKNFKLLTLRTS